MIIKIFFFLVSISFMTNCGNTISQNNSKIINRSISDSTGARILDTTLQTGWHYVLDLDNGFKRQIKKSQVYYFIDPKPIVLSKNFKTLKIYNNQEGIPEMLMTLDEKGTEAWSVATEKYIGKRLAFILDDKLLEADYVNSQRLRTDEILIPVLHKCVAVVCHAGKLPFDTNFEEKLL